MANWSRPLVSFESLQSCLSPPKWFTCTTHVCTCRKNGRSKCMKFQGRITFSWRCSVFRPDSRRICSGTSRAPARVGEILFEHQRSHVSLPSDSETTRGVHVVSELCKTISTISTRGWFHFPRANPRAASFFSFFLFFLATWWRSFILFTTTILVCSSAAAPRSAEQFAENSLRSKWDATFISRARVEDLSIAVRPAYLFPPLFDLPPLNDRAFFSQRRE